MNVASLAYVKRCSVPFSLFFGTLFVTTLSCYTLDFVREGTAEGLKPERYCFDPAVGQYVLARTVNDFHVT
ncbi:hypothetical protein WJX81_003670 [Elliptochloris bilobata]|uniref:Uncharacterized protein n=1 Tax=Elliptochloris bilobata TaxID=381761 RepID=A0AAW1QDU2_9CHLO